MSVCIHNSVASITMTQTYANQEKVPVEALYKFPTSSEFAVSAMSVSIDGKTISTSVMEKQLAQDNYSDAVAAGHTAVSMKQEESNPDVLCLALGRLKAKSEAVVKVTMLAMLDTDFDSLYSFTFPIDFIPKYKAAGSVKKQGHYLNGQFGCDLSISASSKISFIKSKSPFSLKASSPDQTTYSFSIPMQKDFRAKDLHVLFTSAHLDSPSVSLRTNPQFPNEVAALVSFIPASKPATKTDSDDEADELAPGEFIFVIDRSGSMKLDRMSLAKQALLLFLQSIPEKSFFNIYSFGSRFEPMFKESVLYNEKTFEDAKRKVSLFMSNMGGTNMAAPLLEIFTLPPKPTHQRSLFLLTDGAIADSDFVIDLIEKHNFHSRLHTFGIGSGASSYLVTNTARAGKGRSFMIADADSSLNSKVISTLKAACKPAFTSITVDWGLEGAAVKF